METTEACPDTLEVDTTSVASRHPLFRIFGDISVYAAHNFRTIRREFGWASWLLSVWRHIRVFFVLTDAIELVQTPTYSRHGHSLLSRPLLHFCSAKHYLRKGLTVKQRVDLAKKHIDTEHSLFGENYFAQVYERQSVELWSHEHDGHHFRLLLKLAGRALPEGDLQLTLLVDDEPLHKMGFSWIMGSGAGGLAIYIARNQSRWHKDTWVLDAFEAAFPNNSAMMFTYAALQGIAKGVGCNRLIGVRTETQIAHKVTSPPSFDNSYSQFWRRLGGIDDPRELGIPIPVPFALTPIEEVASKHRRRAIQRRENWASIELSSQRTISTLLR